MKSSNSIEFLGSILITTLKTAIVQTQSQTEISDKL